MARVSMVVTAMWFSTIALAQNTTQLKKDSVEKKDRKIIFSEMLLTRFTQSFDKDIDINGKYQT